jgi:RNA polymerase sigma factor (sigma-70 family)
VRSDDDLLTVSGPAFRHLRDEEIVRLLVLHRTRGDHARAKEAWDQLVVNVYDRIRTTVAAWRWQGKDVTIPRQEIEDVTQTAIIRVGGLMENFKGDVLPQFRAFAVTCARRTCQDWSRKEMRHDMGLAGSIDDRVEGDEQARGRFDPDLAREAERRAAREAEQLEAQDMLDRAFPLIPNEDMRVVLQMTLDKVPAEEIAAHLDTSVDNVYQLRRRGLKKLREVLGDGLD